MSTRRDEDAPVERAEPERAAAGTLERYVGNSIRDLRRANGLTIADIADRADISRGMLSRIENGQTASSLEGLSRIARALRRRRIQRLSSSNQNRLFLRLTSRRRLVLWFEWLTRLPTSGFLPVI